MNILILTQSKLLMKIFQDYLNDSHYTLYFTSKFSLFKKIFTENNIDIIFTDNNIDENFSHQDIANYLYNNNLYSRIPIILMTSSNTLDIDNLNFDFILPKPFQKVTLISILKKFVQQNFLNKKKYILIIEDSKLFREKIKRCLSNLKKFEFLEASNSSEARNLIETYSSEIMFITLDMFMPGMNGIEFASSLRQNGIFHPIIMITGKSTPEFRKKAFDAGITMYLSKPFKDEELIMYANFIINSKKRYSSDTILIIDDNPVVLNMIYNYLQFIGIYTIASSDSEEAIKLINLNQFSAIILDVNLPKINGLQLLKKIDIKNKKELMALVYTSDNDPFIVYKAFIVGATDFLKIPFNFHEFYIRVVNILKLHHYIQELSKQNKQLTQLSIQDPLTRLYNKRFFNEILTKKIDECIRYNNDFILVVIDLNKFKQINDNYGHNLGDQVLINVANTIKETIRQSDIPIRFGGDEFVIIFSNQTKEKINIIINKLKNKIEKIKISNHPEIKISASFGAATFLEVYDKYKSNKLDINIIVSQIFQLADERMYKMKKIS